MKALRSKTSDAQYRTYLLKAAREGIDLSWDLYERQQPLCGFGELGLCCSDCLQGPCRIDPFGRGPQRGSCGLGRDELVERRLSRLVRDSARVYLRWALELQETAEINQLAVESATAGTNLEGAVTQSLVTLRAARLVSNLADALHGAPRPFMSQAGIGVLGQDSVNILIKDASPRMVGALVGALREGEIKARRAGAKAGIRISALAGDVAVSHFALPLAGCRADAELALLSGTADEIVDVGETGGTAGVDPATAAAAIVDQAVEAYTRRNWEREACPAAPASFAGGYTASNIDVPALATKIRDGSISGICLVTGCPGVRQTICGPTAEAVAGLVRRGVLCLASGDVVAGLATAGLLNPGMCLAIGAAWESGRFLDLGEALAQELGVARRAAPLAAVIMEGSRPENLAQALGLMATGIPTWYGGPVPVGGSEAVLHKLTVTLPSSYNSRLTLDPQGLDAPGVVAEVAGLLEAGARVLRGDGQ